MLVCACGGDSVEPLFRAEYAATFTEVRDCRSSSDHDLHKIRILADPAALTPYRERNAPFPVGAIVLKEEYDFADTFCDGPVIEWTVMERLDVDDNLGWSWQRVGKDRSVTSEDDSRCIGCHTDCGVGPDGYDGTCAVP